MASNLFVCMVAYVLQNMCCDSKHVLLNLTIQVLQWADSSRQSVLLLEPLLEAHLDWKLAHRGAVKYTHTWSCLHPTTNARTQLRLEVCVPGVCMQSTLGHHGTLSNKNCHNQIDIVSSCDAVALKSRSSIATRQGMVPYNHKGVMWALCIEKTF